MNRIVLLLTVFLLSSCFSDDASIADLKFNRFEQSLFLINAENVEELTSEWDLVFGSFNEVFATQIMFSSFADEKYYNELLAFTSHPDMREAYDSVAINFSDFTSIEKDLNKAFGRFSDEFPSYPIPDITTFFGGFNYGVVTYDDNVAIGLENFLGKNSKFYGFLGDPEYLRFQKRKEFIVSNVMEVWFNAYFQNYLGGRDFLSQMIHKGKLMYFINAMLPDVAMENQFRFTKEQMDWVEENEAEIWTYFVDNDLLFSSNEQLYQTFLDHAPFAKGMPEEAPARIAYFTGYKIVQEYVDNNDIALDELIFITDARAILNASKYKPKR